MKVSAIHHLLSTIVCLGLLAGCGGGDRPALGLVHGTVTWDGKPLANARLAFEPVEPARASAGFTDTQGKYELFYIRTEKGAKIGAHIVRITTADSEVSKPELVPERYNAKSELRKLVGAGENVIDFELTSK